MMDVDSLLEKKRGKNVVYTRFLEEYKKDMLFCFVEGKNDPSFYRTHILHFLPKSKKACLYPSGNKQCVKELHDFFDWNRFSKNQIVFFMDRDYSDLIEDENLIEDVNVYVTDDYSIENDIFSSETLDSTLRDFGFADVLQEKLNNVEKLFDEQKLKFEMKFKEVIAHTVLWKERKYKANLSNYKIENLFDVREGMFFCDKDNQKLIEEAYKQCLNGQPISVIPHHDLEPVLGKLDSFESLKHNFRGKYLESFFVKFCKSVEDNRKKFDLDTKLKIRPITSGDVMTSIAPRVRLPDSLREFLQKTIVQYCNTF